MKRNGSSGAHHSAAYEEARKEFVNCLAMSLIGCGVPLVLAFREWLPIMRAELRKEKESAVLCNG